MKASVTQLLVHLDASPRAVQRLEAARQIGQAHGAVVTALYAVTPSFVELPFSPEVGPGIVDALREIDDERRARARTAFQRSLASPGVHAGWTEVCDDPVMAVFAQQALYADLLVLVAHGAAVHDPAGADGALTVDQ